MLDRIAKLQCDMPYSARRISDPSYTGVLESRYFVCCLLGRLPFELFILFSSHDLCTSDSVGAMGMNTVYFVTFLYNTKAKHNILCYVNDRLDFSGENSIWLWKGFKHKTKNLARFVGFSWRNVPYDMLKIRNMVNNLTCYSFFRTVHYKIEYSPSCLPTRASLREKDDRFRGFIEKFRLFSNQSEALLLTLHGNKKTVVFKLGRNGWE